MGSYFKRTFSGQGKPEVNRWSNITLVSLSDSTLPDHLIRFIWPWLYIQFYEIRLFLVKFRFSRFFRLSGTIVSTLKNPDCIKVDMRLFHRTNLNHTRHFSVLSRYKRQFLFKLIYLLYWKSWMHSTDPVFCQNQGPRSLIWYDFRFPNLQNKGLI